MAQPSAESRCICLTVCKIRLRVAAMLASVTCCASVRIASPFKGGVGHNIETATREEIVNEVWLQGDAAGVVRKNEFVPAAG